MDINMSFHKFGAFHEHNFDSLNSFFNTSAVGTSGHPDLNPHSASPGYPSTAATSPTPSSLANSSATGKSTPTKIPSRSDSSSTSWTRRLADYTPTVTAWLLPAGLTAWTFSRCKEVSLMMESSICHGATVVILPPVIFSLGRRVILLPSSLGGSWPAMRT